jgi:uncharacterized damage-inducible protein DinB
VTIERFEPSEIAPEREMLDGWLDYHRSTLLWKCEALSPEQLRARSVPTTTLTLLGLVRHMAEVERYWFRRIFNGEEESPIFNTDEDPDGDFNDLEGAEPSEVFEIFQAECERSREISAPASLDDLGRKRRQGQEFSLRWIHTHMIEEYARHNGHADLVREAIDGATGDSSGQ